MAEFVEWAKFMIGLFSLIFSIGTFFYVQHDRRQRATVKSINDLSDSVDSRFAEKCKRLTQLEKDVAHIPTRIEFDAAQERGRSELTRIHERIDEINEGIRQNALQLGEATGLLKGMRNEKH